MMGIWGILGQVIWVSLFVQRGALEPLKLEIDIPDLPDIPIPHASASDDGLQSRSSTQTRIVGGKEAIPHSLPWQVGLIDIKINAEACGGVILAPKFVMTAGHCTMNKQPSQYQIWVGFHNLMDQDPAHVSGHLIEKFHDHPNYKYFYAMGYADFDYSVLELIQPINMRDSARPLYLPTVEDGRRLDRESVFVVSGWGNTGSGMSWLKLMQVSVPWISDQACRNTYEGMFKINENMVCAGDMSKGGIDSCKGDSGGPMAWLDPDTDEVKLIGVVSFGKNCADSRYPGVYAELSTVIDWIKGIVGTANEDTCAQGNCMTKSKLKPQVVEDFHTVTPHYQKVTATVLNGPLAAMSI